MQDDDIDKLALGSVQFMYKLIKWCFLQCLVLSLLPFLCGNSLCSGIFVCIGIYTIIFQIYWKLEDPQKRLIRLWTPYVVYLVLVLFCQFIWSSFFPSIKTCLLLPLLGACCFVIIQLGKKVLKRCKYQDAFSTIAVIGFFLVLKLINVSWGCRDHGNFESEKSEILQRREYLIEKLITTPQQVLNQMPSKLGVQFQGEWALYSCSMLTAALVNTSVLYPETSEENLQYIERLIEIVRSHELRRYDAIRWGEDPLSSLQTNTSHISYISHLAWMIGGYKCIGGTSKYDELQNSLCEAMNRRILNAPSNNLQTYPDEPIYIPDMLVAIVALEQYARQHQGKYSTTVEKWVKRARKEWCEPETGLLVSFLKEDGTQIELAPVKGSYSALNCSYLTLIDEEFANEQYELLKKHFWKEGMISGFQEYHDKSPLLSMDIDAGPILFGLSPSGTAFATGAATFFQDIEVRNEILRTAEKAGQTIYWNGKRHYALANIAIVGEAIMLAMRTNIECSKNTDED